MIDPVKLAAVKNRVKFRMKINKIYAVESAEGLDALEYLYNNSCPELGFVVNIEGVVTGVLKIDLIEDYTKMRLDNFKLTKYFVKKKKNVQTNEEKTKQMV